MLFRGTTEATDGSGNIVVIAITLAAIGLAEYRCVEDDPMIRRFKSSDCPDADGRQPLHGEQSWTLTIPLEGGDDYIEVQIGRKGREAIKRMLAQEEIDDAAEVSRG